MLLGAAKYLASTRRFDGTVHFIFQPAEEALGYEGENGDPKGGAVAMIRDGLFERFPMDAIFGMHNRPGLPAGKFGGRPGVIYAAADRFDIEVKGKGGHAARPHLAIDPIFVASQIVVALQGVVARMINPLDSGVVSICEFHSGSACNIIPETALLAGTVRSLEPVIQDRIEDAIRAIATQVASAYGATADVRYERGHPAVNNDPELYAKVRAIGRDLVGPDRFVDMDEPTMGGEDFSNYLKHKPGCFILIGNGDVDRGSVMLHNPRYDFNDDVAHLGASFWAALVENMLPKSD
jgi:hippurate hydrolase